MILEVNNLSKNFNGLKAIDNVSFTVKEGEIFGLLGPNGAGKTTTIRVIATTLTASGGTASICLKPYYFNYYFFSYFFSYCPVNSY